MLLGCTALRNLNTQTKELTELAEPVWKPSCGRPYMEFSRLAVDVEARRAAVTVHTLGLRPVYVARTIALPPGVFPPPRCTSACHCRSSCPATTKPLGC